MAITTSIIIPAYNEEARLARGFSRLAPVLDELGATTTEVIFIDDGSTDKTLNVAHQYYGELPEKLLMKQPKNLGKGAAVRLGIAVAQGDNIIVADADMAINPAQMPQMIEMLRTHALVPGSRTVNGKIEYDSTLRSIAGSTFSKMVKHYTGTTLRDTQCGFKGFQRGAARVLGALGMIDGFAYDAEFFYLAQLLEIDVEPLAVTWDDVRGSSVKLGSDSRKMLHDLRYLSKTKYEIPVVELSKNIEVAAVSDAARKARVQGLALAHGETNTLVVLPRDGSLGGLGIAATLNGTLRTAQLEELKNRTYEAV
jgi:dolichyl-phosphate beta-glucosyltransferase